MERNMNGGIDLDTYNIILTILFFLTFVMIFYLEDRATFWFLDFLRDSFIVLFPVIIFLYIFDLLNSKKTLFPYNGLIVFDILQFMYWYTIKKRYGWYENEDFYKNSKNSLVSIPVIVYCFFIYGFLLGSIFAVQVYILKVPR
jgi:hypothetical protein